VPDHSTFSEKRLGRFRDSDFRELFEAAELGQIASS
jgi:hypothetical protein